MKLEEIRSECAILWTLVVVGEYVVGTSSLHTYALWSVYMCVKTSMNDWSSYMAGICSVMPLFCLKSTRISSNPQSLTNDSMTPESASSYLEPILFNYSYCLGIFTLFIILLLEVSFYHSPLIHRYLLAYHIAPICSFLSPDLD